MFIRNKCAHNEVLFDLQTNKRIPSIRKALDLGNNDNNIYGHIKTILFFLGKISIKTKNELEKNTNNLFTKYSKTEAVKKVIEKYYK